MKKSRIALFLAVFATVACVGDPPDSSKDSGGDGGTAAAGDDGETSPGTGSEGTPRGDGGTGRSGTGASTTTASCANADGGGACGGTTPACCAVQDAAGFHDPTYACEVHASSCADFDGGVAVQCRTGSDCSGGYVCCGRKTEDNTGVFATVMCEPSCTGIYTAGQDMFCDPNDPHACDSDPNSSYCERSMLLPGMYYCTND
ncbi:MAG: hypothetical protein ACRELY_09315 [Polyangiaceae bacterium]